MFNVDMAFICMDLRLQKYLLVFFEMEKSFEIQSQT
jgi:hypothetical protein